MRTAALLLISFFARLTSGHAEGAPSAPRYPVDLAIDPGGRWALTANSGTHSLSAVDLLGGRVIDELAFPQGSRPIRVTATQLVGSSIVLAVVSLQHHHEIAVVERTDTTDGPRLRLRHRVEVGRLPEDVLLLDDGKRALVACAGDSSVVEVDLENARVRRRLPAVEGARHLALVAPSAVRAGGGTLLVVGRNEAAHIDLDSGRLLGRRELAGGTALNPGGVVIVGRRAVLAHQIQPTEVTIEPQMIVWGLVIANRITSVAVDAFARDSVDKQPTPSGGTRKAYGVDVRAGDDAEWVIPLDQRHRANGDPGRLALRPRRDGGQENDDLLLVPSSGTDRLLFVDLAENWLKKVEPLTTETAVPWVPVGDRPTAVVIDAAGDKAYVICSLDDRIDVVSIADRRRIRTISLGAPPSKTAAHNGARIFFDSRRSRGGWYSCHSCHPEGGTRGHRFDTSADGDGLAKKAPDLRGVAETGPWSWIGGFATLEDQIVSTLHRTMAVDSRPSAADVASVVEFLKTLNRPRPTRPGEDLNGDPARGRQLFTHAGCVGCHGPPTYTSKDLENVGVFDTYDRRRRYNPPSLRGVRDRFRWLHDARAQSLESVFRDHDRARKHGQTSGLSTEQFADLIAFLRTL